MYIYIYTMAGPLRMELRGLISKACISVWSAFLFDLCLGLAVSTAVACVLVMCLFLPRSEIAETRSRTSRMIFHNQ